MRQDAYMQTCIIVRPHLDTCFHTLPSIQMDVCEMHVLRL